MGVREDGGGDEQNEPDQAEPHVDRLVDRVAGEGSNEDAHQNDDVGKVGAGGDKQTVEVIGFECVVVEEEADHCEHQLNDFDDCVSCEGHFGDVFCCFLDTQISRKF